MSSPFGVRRHRRRFGFSEVLATLDPKRRRATITPGRLPRRGARLLAAALQIVALFLQGSVAAAQRRAMTTITIDTTRTVNRFKPAHALGAAIDGHDKGVNDLQLTPVNVQAMLSVGLKSLGYRLRTELGGDVWHWNPNGAWSESGKHQGYWTSSDALAEPISLSYGYKLPRRGNTIDQANNVGYSRIDDGDPQTFWKSNPYLDRHFTGEDNSLHAQWIVIEFDKAQPINAVRLLWGRPYARRYRVQYGNFDDVSDIALNPPRDWTDFPTGANVATKLDDTPVRLSRQPIMARWIRIVMSESSEEDGPASNDIRDRIGFGVREIFAGTIDERGKFNDRIRHGLNRHRQTIIHVSSTDPWHGEPDIDEGVEQAGLDRIYGNGLTNGLPMLLPTGLLYDTPENAANEIRYLRARGYKFDRVELGEEPDGQYVTPEDFGALYIQWADAINRVDPQVKLGGPSFQEILPDDEERANKLGNSEWQRRFLDYLKRRGRADDYTFFSFEWYPFDDVCAPVAPQLLRAPAMLEAALRDFEKRGLSRQIPWIISEYGYSAFASRAEIDIEGALLNADIVGKFLTLGGDQAFLFGYTPSWSDRDFPCTAGNNMLFGFGDDGQIAHRFATYFGAQLLGREWVLPGDGVHEIFRASSDLKNSQGEQIVTAYAVHRPDGLWSSMLINKDPASSQEIKMTFRNASSASKLVDPIEVFQFSGEQYQLGGGRNNPYPIKSEPPAHFTVRKGGTITLPPYSLTVVRGRSLKNRGANATAGEPGFRSSHPNIASNLFP